jgi:hypothetical protein
MCYETQQLIAMNMAVFCDVTPRSLVDRCMYLPDTYQNMGMFMVIAMRISNCHVCRILAPTHILSNKMTWEILIYKQFSYFRLLLVNVNLAKYIFHMFNKSKLFGL